MIMKDKEKVFLIKKNYSNTAICQKLSKNKFQDQLVQLPTIFYMGWGVYPHYKS